MNLYLLRPATSEVASSSLVHPATNSWLACYAAGFRLPLKTVEDGFTDSQRAVLNYLENNGPSRTAEIVEGIGMGTSQTNVVLRKLTEIGLVAVSGATSARKYRLVDDALQ